MSKPSETNEIIEIVDEYDDNVAGMDIATANLILDDLIVKKEPKAKPKRTEYTVDETLVGLDRLIEKKLQERENAIALKRKTVDAEEFDKAVNGKEPCKKKRKLAVAVKSVTGLSKESMILLYDRAKELASEVENSILDDINEQMETSMLCPCKFVNNRQCKNKKRSTAVDPDEFCAKCRYNITHKDWKNKKKPIPVKKSLFSYILTEAEEGTDEE